MPALNTNDYAYIIPPSAQFKDQNGEPYSAGYVEFYKHGTSEKYTTYADWSGSRNPFRIPLNSQGRAVAISEIDAVLDMYVYNYLGNLAYSRLNVKTSEEGGGSPLRFTSSDGSVVITRTNNIVDLKVHEEDKNYGTAVSDSVGANGLIEFDTISSGNITVVSAGTLQIEAGKLYHITVALEFQTSTFNAVYCDCQLVDSENTVHKFTLDASRSKQMVELSWDAVSTASTFQLRIQAPAIFTVTSAELYIHSVNPVVGGGSGESYASVEEVELTQEALTSRFGTIETLYNEIEAGKNYLFVYNRHGPEREMFRIAAWSISGTDAYNIYLTSQISPYGYIGYRLCVIRPDFRLHFHDLFSYKFDPSEWVGACPVYIPAGYYSEGQIITVAKQTETIEYGHFYLDYVPVELYKCILGYTDDGHGHHPKTDTTHWQKVYLRDLINQINFSVPVIGTITL